MIKIIRIEKPSELTNEVEKKLTLDYKNNNKAVWRSQFIVDALNKMCQNKCCYCEATLGVQGREMQVDHYHFKDKYPNEVVSWINLIPCCRQCNSNKGVHNTYLDPIINPTVDNPKDYLFLNLFFLQSKDNSLNSKGRTTIELFDLNNRERLLNSRIEIADTIRIKLERIHEKAIDLKEGTNVKQRNINYVRNGIRDILRMGQKDSEYSAVMSTIILNQPDYYEIKTILEDKNLWTDELGKMEKISESIKLDTSR